MTDSHPVPFLVEGQGAAGPKAGWFPSLESGGRLLSFCGAMASETVFGTDRHNCVSGGGSSFWNPFQFVLKARHQAPWRLEFLSEALRWIGSQRHQSSNLEAQGKDYVAFHTSAWVPHPAPTSPLCFYSLSNSQDNLVSQTHPGKLCLLQIKGLGPAKNGW